MTQPTETATPRTDARFIEIERDYDCKFIIEGAWAAAKWWSQALERELAALQGKLKEARDFWGERAGRFAAERDTLRVQLTEAQGQLIGANASISQLNQMLGWKEKELAKAKNEALEQAQRAVLRSCPECGGQGFTVKATTGYGHACGGDERECQITCPIPVPEQTQVQCEYCAQFLSGALQAIESLKSPNSAEGDK